MGVQILLLKYLFVHVFIFYFIPPFSLKKNKEILFQEKWKCRLLLQRRVSFCKLLHTWKLLAELFLAELLALQTRLWNLEKSFFNSSASKMHLHCTTQKHNAQVKHFMNKRPSCKVRKKTEKFQGWIRYETLTLWCQVKAPVRWQGVSGFGKVAGLNPVQTWIISVPFGSCLIVNWQSMLW